MTRTTTGIDEPNVCSIRCAPESNACSSARTGRDAGATTLALVHISPLEARVLWDRTGRPAEVRWGSEHHRVVELAAVRDERAAYPAQRGPRLTLVVRTDDGARASIAFDGRRWCLEALEEAAHAQNDGLVLARLRHLPIAFGAKARAAHA